MNNSMMYPHTITIYNKWYNSVTKQDEYKRSVVRNVFIDYNTSRRIAGVQNNSDELYTLIIPSLSTSNYLASKVFQDRWANHWTLQRGDLVVEGEIFDVITKQKDLEDEYEHVMMITQIDYKGFGNLKHFEVIGK